MLTAEQITTNIRTKIEEIEENYNRKLTTYHTTERVYLNARKNHVQATDEQWANAEKELRDQWQEILKIYDHLRELYGFLGEQKEM